MLRHTNGVHTGLEDATLFHCTRCKDVDGPYPIADKWSEMPGCRCRCGGIYRWVDYEHGVDEAEVSRIVGRRVS